MITKENFDRLIDILSVSITLKWDLKSLNGIPNETIQKAEELVERIHDLLLNIFEEE